MSPEGLGIEEKEGISEESVAYAEQSSLGCLLEGRRARSCCEV
jgi:hypothetical protein